MAESIRVNFMQAMEPADILEFQPFPVDVRVVHHRVGELTISAIWRAWQPGDSGASGRCRLCTLCRAHGDGCLIVVGRKVGRDEAATFDSRKHTDQFAADSLGSTA